MYQFSKSNKPKIFNIKNMFILKVYRNYNKKLKMY